MVEDDYFLASSLVEALEDEGVEVVGPAANIEEAMRIVRSTSGVDGAVLDVNLGGQMSFCVADALLERRVPFVFTTGYDATTLPARYAHVTCCEKPASLGQIAFALFG